MIVSSVHGRRAGFTMVEVVISTSIFIVILLATMGATLSTKQIFQSTASRGQLDLRARRAIDRIVDEFNTAGAAGLSPVPSKPLGSDNLQYRLPTGIANSAITWGDAARVMFQRTVDEPDNGRDDDRDGSIDEGEVILIQHVGQKTETRTVLATDVPESAPGETVNGKDDDMNGLNDERGLSFVLEGSVLTIRLSICGRAPSGSSIVSTQAASIRLRN